MRSLVLGIDRRVIVSRAGDSGSAVDGLLTSVFEVGFSVTRELLPALISSALTRYTGVDLHFPFHSSPFSVTSSRLGN